MELAAALAERAGDRRLAPLRRRQAPGQRRDRRRIAPARRLYRGEGRADQRSGRGSCARTAGSSRRWPTAACSSACWRKRVLRTAAVRRVAIVPRAKLRNHAPEDTAQKTVGGHSDLNGGRLRFAVDTGGTFTDLVVAEPDGSLSLHKTATVPSDPVRGVLDALAAAAAVGGESLSAYLARGEILVHGTTHAINAIVTGTTARTAFLTTQGPSRHAGLPRGRARRGRSISPRPIPSPTSRRRSPSRSPSGSWPTAR